MNLNNLFSRFAINRLERQARSSRRALRDYHRQEVARIRALDIRARGIRLHAAWRRKSVSGAPRTETWRPIGTAALA